MRAVKWVLVVALGVLGAAVGTVVGLGGSSPHAATAASLTGSPLKGLDPVLNDGSNAVLKAVDQGLALVLGGKEGKGGSSGFKVQQGSWDQVKTSYIKGESQFARTTSQASDQFLNGVLSGGDPTDDLIGLLKLISGYQTKVSSAGASWDQAQNKATFDLQTASTASAGGTGAGAGKMTVSDLKGATPLIQTVAKAEVTLYEKVAVAEIEYEGGILDVPQAVQQIDDALSAFETAIEGGAKKLVTGAPVSWNLTVQKKVTGTANSVNNKVNNVTYDLAEQTPPTVTPTTVTTTTTAPQTKVTITCPTPQGGQDGFFTGDPIVVTGAVSPAVSGAAVTMNYDSSPNEGLSNTTDTDTTAANGTFTDTTTAPTVMSQGAAQSIQATLGNAISNACPAELQSGQ